MVRPSSGKVVFTMMVAVLALLVVGSVVVWNAFTGLGVYEETEGQPPPFSGRGSYVVGSDVTSGKYRSEAAEAGCRWQIIVNGRTLQSGAGADETEVDLSRRLSLFQTNDCGTWRWVGE